MSPNQPQGQRLSWKLGTGRKAGLKSPRRGGKAWTQPAGGGEGRGEAVALQQLRGSGRGARRPAASRASSHVGVIFGALWRPLGGVRRSFALPRPQPGMPGTPTYSPGALPCSPNPLAGPQALMNKRPIRRWGAADEWTFRFQAWHRLGFPGVKVCAWTRSIMIIKEPVRNAGSQAKPRPTESETTGWGSATRIFTSPFQ